MRTRARKLVLLTAAALAASLPALSAAAAPTDGRAAGEVFTVQLRDAADVLPLADEDRTGYTRTSFRHWVDADRDGCDTRREVLIAEAVEAPDVQPPCTLAGGLWHSAYDGVMTDTPGSFDVDHLVPLAEAWDSGASAWTSAERQAYANDLDDERSLIAVSARSNRSKADQDIAEWMVPDQEYTCAYVANWVAVKLRWGLAIDSTEQAALTDYAAACPDATISGTTAR